MRKLIYNLSDTVLKNKQELFKSEGQIPVSSTQSWFRADGYLREGEWRERKY